MTLTFCGFSLLSLSFVWWGEVISAFSYESSTFLTFPRLVFLIKSVLMSLFVLITVDLCPEKNLCHKRIVCLFLARLIWFHGVLSVFCFCYKIVYKTFIIIQGLLSLFWLILFIDTFLFDHLLYFCWLFFCFMSKFNYHNKKESFKSIIAKWEKWHHLLKFKYDWINN